MYTVCYIPGPVHTNYAVLGCYDVPTSFAVELVSFPVELSTCFTRWLSHTVHETTGLMVDCASLIALGLGLGLVVFVPCTVLTLATLLVSVADNGCLYMQAVAGTAVLSLYHTCFVSAT